MSGGKAALGSRFDEAEASPGFLLWQVATMWQREVRVALDGVGLTHAQFVMLASAAWLGGQNADAPVTQAQIAEHARTDAVMTSEVLRTLERKRLVRRRAHPGDGRARHITLTAAGRTLVKKAIALVEAADEKFFAAPGPELRALARLLRKAE
jgi:MarR family transcriptional regulator, organic hydroperoxide resistance regulator